MMGPINKRESYSRGNRQRRMAWLIGSERDR
jgi:hypothetical protein